jgi:hypothetical protein
MNLYRYIHDVPSMPVLKYRKELPTLPNTSFTEVFCISHYSDISLNKAEDAWNQHQCLVFELFYTEIKSIYYVLLPNTVELSSTDYKQISMDDQYDDNRHIYDYYLKTTFPLFLTRFQKRIRTRQYLNKVQRSIPFPPTELAYHQQLVEKVSIYSLMDEYELPLIRTYLYESLDIVKEEKEYHPDGVKMLELKEGFEELALLTKSF